MGMSTGGEAKAGPPEIVFLRADDPSVTAAIKIGSGAGRIFPAVPIGDGLYVVYIGCIDLTCRSLAAAIIPSDIVEILKRELALVTTVDEILAGDDGLVAKVVEQARKLLAEYSNTQA